MLKFKNVDIIGSLEQIMLQNTASFQDDFTIDQDIIRRAAASSRKEDKFLLWMSRPTGTHCLWERNVWLQNSSSHNTWTYYEDYTDDEILTYAVELKAVEGDIIRGDIYELDYQTHCKRIKERALPISTKRVVCENGICDLPMDQRGSIHFCPDPEFGEILSFEDLPHDPEYLQDLLGAERFRRSQTAVTGDFKEHIVTLRRNRIRAEAHHLVDAFKKLSEPNDFRGIYFVAKLSHCFSKLASAADCDELIAMLPYTSLRITELLGDGCLYALIDKSERRDVRLRKQRHST